ncbi:MAG TPA: UDP-N-acetylmuramate dehydrogenase [Candidatus Saccharimonadales bacterium]|jgi:UDP-N-acetylmuramate dehydrogenase|nr:UDP-N-acetylmuramate dehydrogenase [Candidatus Saccharimonadales bacterium]
MEIHTNIPLKNYTTMQLGGNARFMVDAHTPAEIAELSRNAKAQNLPLFILGGGSNVIVHDEGFSGLVIRNRIPGFEVIESNSSHTLLRIGAGENWDDVVKRTVDMNLSGIEAMSAIPGTTGAAPIQNVGAYGQEIADTLISLEAYDTINDTFVVLQNQDCGFSYRHSIFRGDAAGRYIVTSITLQLYKSPTQPPFYKALEEYFTANGITLFTPQIIRDAVIKIRSDKLPDPKITPNTGSFFKNALVEEWQLNELKAEYPGMPSYAMPDGNFKIPSGWLIEQAGLKGKTLHGMRVHDKNALVLINESATCYQDLADARDEISGAVRDQFRIAIEQEPLEI